MEQRMMEASGRNGGRSDAKRARRRRRLAQSGVLSAVLFTTVGALAVKGNGCVVAPLSGSAVRITTSTVPLHFMGEADDTASSVTVRTGTLTGNGSGAATLQNQVTLAGPVQLTANASGQKQFDVAVDAAASLWTSNDIAAFQVTENVSGNPARPLITFVPEGAMSVTHNLIGVAKLPDASVFPPTINDPFTPLPGQDDHTFFSIAGTPTPSDAYYAKMGSLDFTANLTVWKFLTGFGAGDDVSAVYFNENELGVGREMHCRAITAPDASGAIQRAACYVASYPNQDDAAAGRNLKSTVAMEFDSQRSDKVRFVAFDGQGNRINEFQFDGGKPVAVPNVCFNCHGGRLQSDNLALNAHFLPFDIAALPTPAAAGAQMDKFKALNKLVWGVERNNKAPGSTSDNAVVELIDGWYGGQGASVLDAASTYNKSFVPAGWSSEPDLYQNVVATYCRTCHISQRPEIAWNTRSQFDGMKGAIAFRVCNRGPNVGPAIVMPHSQRTYQKFWLSGARATLAIDLGLGSCAFTPL